MHWRIKDRREQISRDRMVSLVRQNLDYHATFVPVVGMLFMVWIVMFAIFATWGAP